MTVDGVTQSATINTDGSFSTWFTGLGTLGVIGSPYTINYTYASDGLFSSAGALASLTVVRTSPTVKVSDADGTYSGSPFAATDSLTGVNGQAGATLEGLGLALTYYAGGTATGTPLSGAPTAAGTYTVLAAFAGSSDYLPATNQATFTIARASPTVVVSDAGGTFSGSPFSATDSIAGVGVPAGSTLEGVGLTLTYYAGGTATGTPLAGAPAAAGTYTVAAAFAGSTDFLAGSSQATFTIAQATPTLALSDAGGIFTGLAFAATATVAGLSGTAGATLEGVGLTLSYYNGSTATGTPLSGAPTAAGTYTVAAAFAGSTDYLPGSSQATFTIAPATPTLNLSDAGGTYSGSPFAAVEAMIGVGGSALTLEGVSPSVSYYAGTYSNIGQLAGVTALSRHPTQAGAYTAAAVFAGSADYLATSGLVSFTIARATPTLSLSDAGGTYAGSPFAATDSVAGLTGPAGSTLEGVGLTIAYYSGSTATGTPLSGAPVAAGTYIVTAAFAGSTDYLAGSSQATFTIARASPTLSVNDSGGTFSGSPFAATDSVAGVSGPAGATLEGVGLTLAYYAGSTATGTPLSGTPTTAGTYTVAVAFGGSAITWRDHRIRRSSSPGPPRR